MTTSAVVMMSPAGPQVSRTIAGLMRLREWNLSDDQLRGWIQAVLDLGITTFDHADIYGSYTCEGVFGAALGGMPVSVRQQMQIVTKCDIMLLSANRPDTYIHHYDTTTAHIIQSAENSLRELHTDYLDVLLIHRPDPLMDADAVAEALHQLKRAGKILYAGVSNFMPFHFDLLQSRLEFPLVTNQIEFSPLHLDPIYDGTADLAQRLRHAPMAWSPVAGGRLFSGGDERSQRVRVVLEKLAATYRAGVDQIALAWILMHPARFLPVLGTGNLERIRAAVAAESMMLTRQEWFEVYTASTGHEVP